MDTESSLPQAASLGSKTLSCLFKSIEALENFSTEPQATYQPAIVEVGRMQAPGQGEKERVRGLGTTHYSF